MGLTIGEVSRRTGIAPSALRYYERERLVPRAARQSGRRVYEVSILERLRLIAMMRQAGLGIGAIRNLLRRLDADGRPGSDWPDFARGRIADLDRQIAETSALRRVLADSLTCDCANLSSCRVLA